MERKRYLELCQLNAVYPATKTVLFDGIKYHPMKLKISFDEKGRTKNTAIIKDTRCNSYIHASLERLEENVE